MFKKFIKVYAIPKNMNYVMIFSILTGLFAICTAVAQHLKEKTNDGERIAELNKINDLQTRLIESNEKVINANERIENMNIKQLDYQSGGDSYGYIDLLKIFDENRQVKVMFAFNKSGEFPIYNVTVTYWNIADFNIASPDGFMTEELFKNYKSVEVGDVASKKSRPITQPFILNEGLSEFNFTINSKNGSFSQSLKAYKNGNNIVSAYRVKTSPEDKSIPVLLKEHVDEDFPLKEVGQIWK